MVEELDLGDDRFGLPGEVEAAVGKGVLAVQEKAGRGLALEKGLGFELGRCGKGLG